MAIGCRNIVAFCASLGHYEICEAGLGRIYHHIYVGKGDVLWFVCWQKYNFHIIYVVHMRPDVWVPYNSRVKLPLQFHNSYM